MAAQPGAPWWAPQAANWAPVNQLGEPTRENVEAIVEFVDALKYPSTPWRHILSSHNTNPPGGASPNAPIAETMRKEPVRGGFKVSLDWHISYLWNDELRVQATSDVFWSERDAKVHLFKMMFGTLLLRAPDPECAS